MEARDFQWYRQQLFALYKQQRYREALTVAQQAAERFPEREARTAYWRACLHSRLGELETALTILQEALQRGHWWAPQVFNDPDLDPVRERPEFQAIVAQCEQHQKTALPAPPELLVFTPKNLSSAPAVPLLIALHGAGNNAQEFAPSWQAAVAAGWLLAVPQSTQPMGSSSFGGFWWGDQVQAEAQVAQVYSQICKTYPVDSSRLVVAGFSQGGALAIRLALQGALPCRGFIGVAPSLREPQALFSFIGSVVQRGLKGVIMTGDRDYALAGVQRFHDEATRQGLECQLWVEPGLGHEFPPDFATKLLKALDFIVS